MTRVKATLVRILVSCVVLGVGIAIMSAETPAAAKRPSTIPSEYHATPFGYFHPSCVKQLDHGDILKPHQFAIQHQDGSLEAMPTCNYPHYDVKGNVVSDVPNKQRPQVRPPEVYGWVEDYSYYSSVELGLLYDTWTVPPAPTTESSQTLYFFSGMIDDSDPISILQPVLAWDDPGYGPSNAWSIAGWNCCIAGSSPYATVYESTPVTVNAGDTIVGEIYSDCTWGTLSCPGWDVYAYDATLGQGTELVNSNADGQIFNTAYAGVLEAYDVTECSEFPSNGSITFNNQYLYNYDIQYLSPTWTFENRYSSYTPQCSYGGSTSSNSLTLDYGSGSGGGGGQAAAPSNSGSYTTTSDEVIFTISLYDTTPGAVIYYDTSCPGAAGEVSSGGSFTVTFSIYSGCNPSGTMYATAPGDTQSPTVSIDFP